MPTADIALTAYKIMYTARVMGDTYDANRKICRYIHSTSRGHEAIQIATGLQLLPCDFVSPYYRDDSMLLALGFTPYQLMLQLLAKADDPFSAGRSCYSHPSSNAPDKPIIIHQSSATGMQAIPATGIAQGLQYIEQTNPVAVKKGPQGQAPVVVCSLGDASMAEGEVSEAMQFAVLKQLPVLFLVQDNQLGISVTAQESRAMNAYEYAAGFKGLKRMQCNGSNFEDSYLTMQQAISTLRTLRKPVLVLARVPLLGHHTSGIRKEMYRTRQSLLKHGLYDPLPALKNYLHQNGVTNTQLAEIEALVLKEVKQAFSRAIEAAEPQPHTVSQHMFAPTTATKEKGDRKPADGKRVMMVQAAVHAVEEIMQHNKHCIIYGHDVASKLGGVFRETATLAHKFGSKRVFNSAIQEAYMIGSAIGLSAVGIKPIVHIQFGDYIYPGFNQLATEVAKSCYLSNGKFPVSMLLRIPVGAFGGGGPYHSASIESTLLQIRGIKICYPSNAADIKGLMKAAFADPNPVVMLEHKALYWSKLPGTANAQSIEPGEDYVLPLGKANVVLAADTKMSSAGNTVCIVAYGMGVHWAVQAAENFEGRVEVIDLRTLYPLDEKLVFATVRRHGKCIVLTEEQLNNSFAEALALRITNACYHYLDARVETIGALDLPAVPTNILLEAAMLPNAQKVSNRIAALLKY